MKYLFYRCGNLMYCMVDNGELRQSSNPKYIKMVHYGGVYLNDILTHSELIEKYGSLDGDLKLKGSNDLFELK